MISRKQLVEDVTRRVLDRAPLKLRNILSSEKFQSNLASKLALLIRNNASQAHLVTVIRQELLKELEK